MRWRGLLVGEGGGDDDAGGGLVGEGVYDVCTRFCSLLRTTT